MENIKFEIMYLISHISIKKVIFFMFLFEIMLTISSIVRANDFLSAVVNLFCACFLYIFYVFLTNDWKEYNKFCDKKEEQNQNERTTTK